MKLVIVEEENEQKAQRKLIHDLGVLPSDLRCVRQGNRKFSFEVLSCPAVIDIDVSKDGLKAHWKKLEVPIGENAPKLDLAFFQKTLEKKGIVFGVKMDVISAELDRILKDSHVQETTTLNLLIAEGIEPVPTKCGKAKWTVEPKIFEKGNRVFVRKGEVVAKAMTLVKGREGRNVKNEAIAPPIQEQERLSIGQGIEVTFNGTDTLYVAKYFGEAFFDQGTRMRVECDVIDLEEGLLGAIETNRLSLSGVAVTAKDLLQAATDKGIAFGLLGADEVNAQLAATKKWPAKINIARGQNAKDGGPGKVSYPYLEAKTDKPSDQARVKARMVFPNEILAIIQPPSEPVSGKTIFGEVLRGRAYQESPLYPGKNVSKEKSGNLVHLKSSSYGVAVIEKDRITVGNPVEISDDKMVATMDLFPHEPLSVVTVSNLLKDKDVLFGYEREKLEASLMEAHRKGLRIEKFVLARGKPYQTGADAKVKFYFNAEEFDKKGLFQRKTPTVLFVLPGDLLIEKTPRLEAEEGTNIFREKIPVPVESEPKDILIKTGDNVVEVEIDLKDEENKARKIQYRSDQLGILVWQDRLIDVKSTFHFDAQEKFVQVAFASKSDFGTQLTLPILEKIALEEGVKVPLDTKEIEKVLKTPRPAVGGIYNVTIAKSIDPKEGTDAKISYFVEYNAKPVEQYLYAKATVDAAPEFADCVRSGDVLGIKTSLGVGEDGKTVFGRKIPATRGKDENWLYGAGVDRSEDKLQIFCSLPCPGFVFVEKNKIVVKPTVQIAKDKMSATISIYPTKNPRFKPSLDKLLAMIQGAGIKFGINKEALMDGIERCIVEGKPVLDLVIAQGRFPTKGKEAFFHYTIDTGTTVGELRQDGSVDFKNRGVYQNVRESQLLLIKHPAEKGEDGMDLVGNIVPSALGADARMDCGEGVRLSENRLEYRATIDGIVEVLQTSIRVLPGLFIREDVSFKTGNIEAGATQVIVKGSVLPDFSVTAEKEILVEKVAEACTIKGLENVKINGGIIGRHKAYVYAGKDLDALYISAEATVEALGNINVRTEVLNSSVRCQGLLTCVEGAGTICGGEIWAFGGIKTKVIGAAGSEAQTTLRLGEHYFKTKEANAKIEEEGLPALLADLDVKIKDLAVKLNEIYAQIPEATKKDLTLSQRLQEEYRQIFDQRKSLMLEVEKIKARREAILAEIPRNKDASIIVHDLIHPGVTIIYKDVVWKLKEPIRGVEIKWNAATSNLISRRL